MLCYKDFVKKYKINKTQESARMYEFYLEGCKQGWVDTTLCDNLTTGEYFLKCDRTIIELISSQSQSSSKEE